MDRRSTMDGSTMDEYENQDDPPPWKLVAGKPPLHSLPSEFRTNVEAGLRTALSLAIAFLWMGYGPFDGSLSFFTGVTAIVCVGNSAGQTIGRSLEITQGALMGAICAVLPRWLMQWGLFPVGIGFFVSVFLVLRSRRLTSLGKKFGCVGVTILVLADLSDEGLTADWALTAVDFVRTNIEGGVFALVAVLFPYPRYTTRDVAVRGEFMCHSLSMAVRSCVIGFIKGRDETNISRARLLCVQVRHHLTIMRKELEWSRLELGLLCGGFFAGGLRLADALEEEVEVMDQVLQGVRGMRESLWSIHRTRAQASFARVVSPALRDVSEAVTASLEAISTRDDRMPTLPVKWCQKKKEGETAQTVRDKGHEEGKLSRVGGKAVGGVVETVTRGRTIENVRRSAGRLAAATAAAEEEDKKMEDRPAATAQLHPNKALEWLEEAVLRMMQDYNRARKEVLYGLDAQGRPLEAHGNGEDKINGSANPRKPVPFSYLQALGKRDLPPPSPNAVDIIPDVFSRPSEGFPEEDEDVSPDGGGVGGVPNHVLVMQERQKLGSSATMARGAFVFSLHGLCGDLTRKRTSCSGDWRLSDSTRAARFVLLGLWKAVRPPPGLLKYALKVTRGIVNFRRRQARRELQQPQGSVGGNGGVGVGDLSESMRRQERKEFWYMVGRNHTFWCLKVSIALTLCAAFRLSPVLDDLFEPAIWIPVTTCFVMESQSASALTTCLRRLIGTVMGAVYGIVTAKLSDQSTDDPYSYQSFAILLPWVAITCFFRNSATFAYPARVAAFTAVVIFTGSNSVLGADGEVVSLARIVNTVMGSLIYLFVDILLVPTRAKVLLYEQTYLSLDAALKEVTINDERLFGVRASSRECPRQLAKRLRLSSDSGAFSPAHLIPALARQDSGIHMPDKDERLARPKALGETWAQPHELSQEDSTATEEVECLRVSVGVEVETRKEKGGRKKGGDDEGAAALAMAEEGRRKSREAKSRRQRLKQYHHLQDLVNALEEQRKFLPLAELEPQLWYAPFPASAYHGMIDAQEELVRALSLMSRAAIAVSEDHSKLWRVELMELGNHLASLLQLLKVGLEDASSVFASRDPSKAFRGWDGPNKSDRHGIHLLDVQAEAIRLDSDVNTDFVKYIQAFLERGAFPTLEMESILRVSTATISVMGLQKALLMLGHSVATVLDRESFPHFYR